MTTSGATVGGEVTTAVDLYVAAVQASSVVWMGDASAATSKEGVKRTSVEYFERDTSAFLSMSPSLPLAPLVKTVVESCGDNGGAKGCRR